MILFLDRLNTPGVYLLLGSTGNLSSNDNNSSNNSNRNSNTNNNEFIFPT